MRLNESGVRYLVIGGAALSIYNYPRYTQDIDFFISSRPEDVARFRQGLASFGFPLSDQAAEEMTLPNRMIILGHEPNRMDFLNQIKGVEFESAWEKRNEVVIDGIPVPFISLDDLIATKVATARPQDLIDVEILRKRNSS